MAASVFKLARNFKDSDIKMAWYYLGKCIEHAADQAVFYYFDVLWDVMAQEMSGFRQNHDFQPYTADARRSKLNKAISLSPNWKSPYEMRERLGL
ncbi:hypothetical protein N9O85_02375 [Porticoccaceae bacterium]|nr:hypothetical protein [Porticoccaceae bacterium]